LLEEWHVRRRATVWLAKLALVATALLGRPTEADTRSDADLGVGIFSPPPL
jgi:hypothetical protein